MKERAQNTNPETAATEFTIIPTSIRIQEDNGRFSALSMVIEYEGLPHIAIAQKPRYSSWFIHAPTSPLIFSPLASTEGIDITTAEKMLEILNVEINVDEPEDIGKLLYQELDKKTEDYKKIYEGYLKNSEKHQAYGNAVRTFAENLKNQWEDKRSTS